MRLEWRGLLLAVAYALGYWISRKASLDQWFLPSGLRFAVLLVLPIRYWPYIFLGEAGSLLTTFYPKVEIYGIAWLIVSSITVLPAVAGVVYVIRKYSGLPRISNSQDVVALLLGAAACVVTSTVVNRLTVLWLMKSTSTYNPHSAAIYLLGDYLGILMIAPLALLWTNRHAPFPMPGALRNGVFRIVIPSIAALALIGHLLPANYPDAKQAAQFAMIIPIAWLTKKQGWRGAAIAGIAANLGIRLARNGAEDVNTLQAQQFIAVSITMLLMLGSMISDLYSRMSTKGSNEMQALSKEKEALMLVKQGFLQSESQLQQSAQLAAQAYDQMQQAANTMVKGLRQAGLSRLAMSFNRDYLTHTRVAANRVIEMLYPSHFDGHGLFAAIDTAPFKASLQESNIKLSTNLQGDPDTLSRDLQLSSYRLINHALAYVTGYGVDTIRLSVRSGGKHKPNGGWIAIVIQGAGGDPSIKPTSSVESQALQIINSRVLSHHGILHADGRQISLLIRDCV